MKRVFAFIAILLPVSLFGQHYTGMGGMIHVPSADTGTPASLRIGVNYVNEHFVPDYSGCVMDVPVYSLALTPYKWVEASYVITGWRKEGTAIPDRSLSLKIKPLQEGRWWPALAIGCQDPLGTGVYTNFYVAASKHFRLLGTWSANVAYRRYYAMSDVNEKWEGLVGGLTYSPSFVPALRLVGEYDGAEINLGVDCLFFKMIRLNAFVQDFRYFGAGISLEISKL